MPHFHSPTYSTGQSRNFHFSFHLQKQRHFGNFMSRIQPTSYSNTLKHNISQSTKSSWLPFHCIQIFRLLSTWLWRLLRINNQLARLLNTMLSILRNRWDNIGSFIITIITNINIVSSIIINIKILKFYFQVVSGTLYAFDLVLKHSADTRVKIIDGSYVHYRCYAALSPFDEMLPKMTF